MNQLDVMKRDNLLVDFLLKHRGRDNCLSSREIANFLGEKGYKTNLGTVHNLVRKVMFERHLPICSASGHGYYWAETQAEIQATIDDLNGRIVEMQNRIEHLQKFILK